MHLHILYIYICKYVCWSFQWVQQTGPLPFKLHLRIFFTAMSQPDSSQLIVFRVKFPDQQHQHHQKKLLQMQNVTPFPRQLNQKPRGQDPAICTLTSHQAILIHVCVQSKAMQKNVFFLKQKTRILWVQLLFNLGNLHLKLESKRIKSCMAQRVIRKTRVAELWLKWDIHRFLNMDFVKIYHTQMQDNYFPSGGVPRKCHVQQKSSNHAIRQHLVAHKLVLRSNIKCLPFFFVLISFNTVLGRARDPANMCRSCG